MLGEELNKSSRCLFSHPERSPDPRLKGSTTSQGRTHHTWVLPTRRHCTTSSNPPSQTPSSAREVQPSAPPRTIQTIAKCHQLTLLEFYTFFAEVLMTLKKHKTGISSFNTIQMLTIRRNGEACKGQTLRGWHIHRSYSSCERSVNYSAWSKQDQSHSRKMQPTDSDANSAQALLNISQAG